MTKRIGVLTSGGDCAGLNTALRAITHRAIYGYGWEVFGIKHGTIGLLQSPLQYQQLTVETFENGLHRLGGTFLGSVNKGDPFAFPMPDGTLKDRTDEIVAGYNNLKLDALIGVGGDGSLRIIPRIVERGNLNFISIPKTIDDDLAATEHSIGFATAVDIATEALDRLHPTAASHDRVIILEVMGRDAGHIALNAGIAGAADVILIPEIPYKLESINHKLQSFAKAGRHSALIVVAEGVKTEEGKLVTHDFMDGRSSYGGIGYYLADQITKTAGIETRCTVLGHVQRGAQPNANDRVLASALGVFAVDLAAQGKFDRMVAWQNGRVVDVPISDVVGHYNTVDVKGALVQTARGLGISLGD